MISGPLYRAAYSYSPVLDLNFTIYKVPRWVVVQKLDGLDVVVYDGGELEVNLRVTQKATGVSRHYPAHAHRIRTTKSPKPSCPLFPLTSSGDSLNYPHASSGFFIPRFHSSCRAVFINVQQMCKCQRWYICNKVVNEKENVG